MQLGLPAVWTEARARGFALEDVARWMSAGPRRDRRPRTQGRDRRGKDADLVVFEPDEASEVDPAELQHRNPVTPYAGRRLDGRVWATYVRGVEVYADGRFRDEPGGPPAVEGLGVSDVTTLPDLAAATAGRDGAGRERRVLRAQGEPPEGPRPRCSTPIATPTAARRWTAGRRAAAASRATTGASSGSACPAIVRGVVVDTSFFRGNYPEPLFARGCRRARRTT